MFWQAAGETTGTIWTVGGLGGGALVYLTVKEFMGFLKTKNGENGHGKPDFRRQVRAEVDASLDAKIVPILDRLARSEEQVALAVTKLALLEEIKSKL